MRPVRKPSLFIKSILDKLKKKKNKSLDIIESLLFVLFYVIILSRYVCLKNIRTLYPRYTFYGHLTNIRGSSYFLLKMSRKKPKIPC